ncbi:MAG: hypothetical protein EOO36_18480, partial [Cytophagaceae bacterium]
MNLRNLGAYLHERFSPINMGLLVVLFGTVRGLAALAGALQRGPASADGPGLVALGALATVSFFFRLRVFDEEKDFAQDALHHPHRVLQTGRVTLPQLRALAWAGAALEAGWSAAQEIDTLLLWGIALVYSVLMRVEFGVGRWLRARLVLYALSH